MPVTALYVKLRAAAPASSCSSGIFGHAGELAGDLLAVRLVVPADLPDESASMIADSLAPGADLISRCGDGRWLSAEDLLRILREQRVDGAGAADAGFGGAWSPGE